MSAGVFPRVLALPLALLLLVFLSAAVPVHAADDSNAGQLTQVPTVTPQQLSSAIATLEQGNSDPQVQSLLSQFQSQLNSANYTGAEATLNTLQGLSSSSPGSVSPTLNALLQSLSVGSDGASVNANTLATQLSSASASSETAQKLSTDMASLAGLMQYANSTLASELLQNSSLLSQSAFTGSGGSLGSAPVSLPGVSGFSGVSVPSIGTPALSVGGLGGGAPSIPFEAFAIPVIAAALILGAYFARGRIARVAGSQRLPGMSFLKAAPEEAGPVPTDPRARIEYYFGRAVSLMSRRGVPKLGNETHREFSAKCEGKPERPQVATISDLYEKAKFSGEEVGGTDAYLAASSYIAMEKLER